MNRRGFLGGLIGAVAAAAILDPERLLWVPGEKKIFISPPPKPQVVVVERHMVLVHEDGIYNWDDGIGRGGYDTVSYKLEMRTLAPNEPIPPDTLFVYRDGFLTDARTAKRGVPISALPEEYQRVYLKALGCKHPIDIEREGLLG